MATSFYSSGTISLTNGSAVVTGNGTAWVISLVTNGWIDPIMVGGHRLPIASVDSDTEITAEFAWQGPTGTYPYSIQRDGDQVQDNAENAKNLTYLLQELRKGTLFKYDASGTLADRALFDGRPKNFSYLVLDGEDAQLWVKASATEGDWSGPYAYGTGPVGPMGPAGYANPRGNYDDGTAYVRNDAVLSSGSTWVALQAVPAGNPPPNLPTTSNAYWQLIAQKGMDGTGIGDMLASVYDPRGLQSDIFEIADALASGKLSLSGGKMTGPLDMGGQALKNAGPGVGNYVKGLITSKTAAFAISVAPGEIKGNGRLAISTAPFTKLLNAAWVAGSDNGGRLDAAALTANTTYFPQAIIKDSDGSFDWGYSLLPIPAVVPPGYSWVGRFDWCYTNAAGNAIWDYTQDGSTKRLPLSPWYSATTTGVPGNVLYTLPAVIPVPLGIPARVDATSVLTVNASSVLRLNIGDAGPLSNPYEFRLSFNTGSSGIGFEGSDKVKTNSLRQLRTEYSGTANAGSVSTFISSVEDFTLNREY